MPFMRHGLFFVLNVGCRRGCRGDTRGRRGSILARCWPPLVHFGFPQQMELGGPLARRLLVACALGGAIGLEREWRHKDSGLRTNMLICMGSALFTIMSVVLAGSSTPNKGQVAANIVQGIGFLGAGLILHTKSRVLGLTSAATVFVVAAIGMTCGAGMYMEARHRDGAPAGRIADHRRDGGLPWMEALPCTL